MKHRYFGPLIGSPSFVIYYHGTRYPDLLPPSYSIWLIPGSGE